jgi:hypothetical protein
MFDLTRCLLCRPVAEPQGDLGALASSSCTRSPDPTVVGGGALPDDAWTASPLRGEAKSRAASPPVADSRVESPPRAVEAGGGASAGDVGETTSPRVIDVDPISARPVGVEDLIKDQPGKLTGITPLGMIHF